MPLGNLTSQFFANVYLNELDQFVKHQLKAKYYLRYVDDFVILHADKHVLFGYQDKINGFLKQMLGIELHSGKSKIIRLGRRVNFLGFRVFYYHRLLKKQNVRKMRRTFEFIQQKYSAKEIRYDEIYDFLEGWIAYAKSANTYSMRKKLLAEFENTFPQKISAKELSRYLNGQKDR